jgi:hypothetical protein
MTPEEIVRELAEAPEPAYEGHDAIRRCLMCSGDDVYGKPYVVTHDDDCPWNMAQKWVDENPESEDDNENNI